MSKIQNPSGKTSVEEFASGEISSVDRSSIVARAREQRAARLFAEDPKPTAKSAGIASQDGFGSLDPSEVLQSQTSASTTSTTSTTSTAGSSQSGGDSAGDSAIEEFKFLECDPVTIDEPPAGCPFCTKDPTAYVPDYTTMFPGEVFYDGRECTYCISMEVAPPNLGGPTVDQLNNDDRIKDEIKRTAINKLLEAYNKSKEATVYYYLEDSNGAQSLAGSIGSAASAIAASSILFDTLVPDPVPGYTLTAEQRDVVEELLSYTTLHYTIPVQLKARTKLKISIDSEVFFRAPANAVTDPETVFETGGYEVTLKGKNFSRFGDIYKVIRSMRLYSNQFVRWQAFDGGRISTVIDNNLYALNLEKEADMLEEFQSHVTSMLYDSGFKNMKKVENITFKFEPEGETLKLKQVVMNKFGCPDVTFAEDISLTKSKFLSLVNNDEFKRATTLFYVGSLPEMHADVVAREPLPWLEFILKYTYPSLQVYYPEDADMLNDMTLGSCFADSVLKGDGATEEFINESLKELLSLPDAFLEEFANNLCKTPEELDKEKKTLKERLTEGASGAYEKEKSTITKGNPYFETVFETIERELGYTSSADEQRDVIYEKVINPLGYCGWIALMMKALECVGKGLPIDEFKESMVEAALGAMDDVAFQKLLIGLPPDVQAQLGSDMADELTGLPAPWDTQAYQIGNYPGGEFTKEMLYTEDQKMENDDYKAAKESFEATKVGYNNLDPAKVDAYYNAQENLLKVNNKEFPGTIVGGVQDTSGGILGIGYDGEDFNFGDQSKGSGGTYATALGNIQKDVFDAYRNQALKSIGVDTLLDEMGKLPGAPIIAGFLTSLPCKPTPPWAFDPRLDSFMNTIEFDFCQVADGKMFDITAPKWPNAVIGWSNIWRAFTAAVEEAIKSLLVKLAIQAIKSLLNWVLNLACDSLALLGASLGDLLTGSDNFKDLLAAGLCPDEDPETVNDALLDLFNTLGGPDASCFSEVTGDEMGAFIDDLSMMLTQDQICSLLKGASDPETLRLAAEVARANASECIAEVFSSEDMIASLFAALGKLMPTDEICADSAGSDPAFGLPAADCPPDTLSAIEDLRKQLLANKGLTPDEIRDELDKLKDALLDAAKDLANLMENGPYGALPPLVGDGCTEGVVAAQNPLMGQVADAVNGMILSPIETSVITDMFGRVEFFFGGGGFFNTVLSDTQGRPWKGHNFMVRLLGSPRAEDQNVFEFMSDNAIKSLSNEEPDYDIVGGISYDPQPVDIYNNKVDPANFLDISSGGFPPTVAAWLAKHYRELDPVFKTVTIPPGYSSIQAAADDITEKTALRSANLESRKKYVEAFIVANNLDENDSHKEEVQFAGILRETVQKSFGKLFISGKKDEEPSELSAEEKMTRQVLLGRGAEEAGTNKIRCCSDVNSFDITDAVEIKDGEGTHPSEWPHGAQEQAETNGLAWADWASSEFGDTVPVEVPSSTTLDVYIPYVGHATEEEPVRFTVGYDYNLFEDGAPIKKGGDYRIKITKETPADTSLDEPGMVLNTHDLLVESTILPEVQIVLDNLPLSETVNDSWQMETFYRLISEVIINNSTSTEDAKKATSSAIFREYFAGTGEGADRKYDSISSGFIKRIANRIAVGKSYPEPNVTLEEATADDSLTSSEGEAPEEEDLHVLDFLAPSFRFGYDPDKQPEIIKLDNETYGGPLARLFPDVFPPPFYVQPPAYTGWFDLVDALMPATDGCDPTGTLFFDLSDLQSLPSQVGGDLVEDPRLSYDALCSQEAPYDKIYPNMTIGSLEMIMRSTTRIYLSSMFLNSIATISQFTLNTENYDEGLFEYIAQDMTYGLKESGRKWYGKASDEYYYRFLEQVVNVTARKVQSGMIDPETDFTEEEKEAYDIIAEKVLSFYEDNEGGLAALSTTAISQQNFVSRMLSNGAADSIAGLGAGSAAFSKKAAENAKEAAFDLMIYETIDQATVFLKKMIREEMSSMGEIFNKKLLQPVQNIDHLFLLSTTWIRGGLNGDGPLDVISDPTDPNKYEIPSGLPTADTVGGLAGKFASTNEDFAASLESAFADIDEWPFVLEKYIRIMEKDTPNDLGRAENLYGVVNINDWDAFVANASQSNSGKISDFWGEYELNSETSMANKHFHLYELDENGNGKTMDHISEAGEVHNHEVINFEMQEAQGHVHELDMPAWRFGLRICYMPEKDKTGLFTDVMKEVSASTVMREKAFRVQSMGAEGEGTLERVLIPIASAEINIPDNDFSLFNPESYDVYCLIQDLIDTPTYKTWFRYVFPMPRFVTILAIYNATCFMDSLGNTGLPEDGGDMWEKKGNKISWLKGFGRWDRDKMFKKSKKEARKAFRSIYQTTQPDYGSDRELFDMPQVTFLELMRPVVNFEDGLSWWQRGRKIKTKPEDLC
jgi:hypothetical protein